MIKVAAHNHSPFSRLDSSGSVLWSRWVSLGFDKSGLGSVTVCTPTGGNGGDLVQYLGGWNYAHVHARTLRIIPHQNSRLGARQHLLTSTFNNLRSNCVRPRWLTRLSITACCAYFFYLDGRRTMNTLERNQSSSLSWSKP